MPQLGLFVDAEKSVALPEHTRRLLCIVLETEHEASAGTTPARYAERMRGTVARFIKDRRLELSVDEAIEIWRRDRT